MQMSQRVLYTVSSSQPSLDAIYPTVGSNTRPINQLYRKVQLSPETAIQAVFEPQQAAAAVVDGQHIGQSEQAGQQLLQRLRSASHTLFIIYWHAAATEDAGLRWAAFRAGANMVTHCRHAVATALQQVAAQQQHYQQQPQPQQKHHHHQQQQQQQAGEGCIACDWCGLPGLTAAEYWQHQPLYHIDHHNKEGVCQVCGRHTRNIARHLHDHHSPAGSGPEERTGVFALCIIRRPSDGKFLMTQEYAVAGFWVPGGGVDPGESLTEAAVRECWEEAGVCVTLKGILALESHHAGAWRRIIFWGEPLEANTDIISRPAPSQQQQQQRQQLWPCCCPKTMPDFESAGACWVSVLELQQLTVRSPSEPFTWFAAMADGTAEQLPFYRSMQMPAQWQGVFEGFPVS